MKNIFKYIAIFSICLGFSQDTIQVAKGHKVALIFNEKIDIPLLGNQLEFYQEVISKPSSNMDGRIVLVSYNDIAKDKANYTDFTVFLESGVSHTFILSNVKSPKQHTYKIGEEIGLIAQKKAQGSAISLDTSDKVVKAPVNYFSKDITTKTENDLDATKIPSLTAELYKIDKTKYMETRSFYLLHKKGSIHRYFAREGNVALWFIGNYYNNNELYLQFTLDNREGVDYDINFIEFTINSTEDDGTHQKTTHKPLFTYKLPSRVNGRTKHNFIAVFDKFSLSKDRQLTVDVDEKHGARSIILDIDSDLINNPERL